MLVYVETSNPEIVVPVFMHDGRLEAPAKGGNQSYARRGEAGLRIVMSGAETIPRAQLLEGSTILSFEKAAAM